MPFPRICNQFQHSTCELWLGNSTVYFIYKHIQFFDLSYDWSVSAPASFVPYQWELNFYLRDFELLLMVNEHNWIDCTNEDENTQFAICGEVLDINFTLPFTQFLLEREQHKFFF